MECSVNATENGLKEKKRDWASDGEVKPYKINE